MFFSPKLNDEDFEDMSVVSLNSCIFIDLAEDEMEEYRRIRGCVLQYRSARTYLIQLLVSCYEI